jgi:RND family efflux transporter MFP subunit
MREKFKRPLFLLIAISLLLLVVLLIDEEANKPDEVKMNSIFIPQVSYVAAIAGPQRSTIVAYGELKPKWDVILKAQVRGAINYIAPVFESGSLVNENTVLIRVEDTPYQSEKSSAEVTLAEAKLQLVQAQKKTLITNQDWQQSGINKPASDLALFKPQLKIAQKALESAQQQFRVAQNNLSYTRVKTPFKGIIIERMVGLGQQVVEGEPLLRLIDHQNLYLKVFLSETQWHNLAENWLNSQANLYSSGGELIAVATIIRGGYHLNSDTRQYPLFMEVNSVDNGLAISGQFMQVKIAGKEFNDYLILPESALTQEGTVWLIDKKDTLRSYQPKDIHYQDKQVLVPVPDKPEYLGQKTWRVATIPLASFLTGKQVKPTKARMEK